MAAMSLLLWRLPSSPAPLLCFNSTTIRRAFAQCTSSRSSSKRQEKKAKAAADSLLKRRTRSVKEFDQQSVRQYVSEGDHVPVMLGEVLEVFARPVLTSFVDCTLGAAGHSSAIIRAHPELQLYVGLDVDPVAHEKAQVQINGILSDHPGRTSSNFKVYTLLKNFKEIKSVLHGLDRKLLDNGVDGILMDLGMSSMQVNNAERGFSVLNDGPLDMRMNPQATLRAEDILNSWPEAEVGRILNEYGEESNWYYLQAKIVKARLRGGLHSTRELLELVRSTSPRSGGRQGWIKTGTRVFQALRIAVNDELKTLKDALYACFDCLSSGGRLAVISFHSLEDRIVKQSFLDIIHKENEKAGGHEEIFLGLENRNDTDEEEQWIKQRIRGRNGTVLTKRPVTPSEEEERLNVRCRSAKLRVIQKA